MDWVVKPPGTLLQLLYLESRLSKVPVGRFIEVGPGAGDITETLLRYGWRGVVYEFDSESAARLETRFKSDIAAGRLEIRPESFEVDNIDEPVQMVISCMVMEHLSDIDEAAYMSWVRGALVAGGVLIGLVPGSPCDWGIEDATAGHFRRYDRWRLERLFREHGFCSGHIAGLTFPLSNLLLKFSNFLVNRAEGGNLSAPIVERTRRSGRRHVPFKTTFPRWAILFLNRYTLLPFHWLQIQFSGAERCLVLYFEATSPRQ